MAQIVLSRPRSTKSRLGFWQFFNLYRGRQALAQLDDAQLRDIGVTKEEAMREANRPIWDAPIGWK